MCKRINRTEIGKMIEGTVPSDTDYEPFIVLKEKVTSLITKDVSWNWMVICNPLNKKNGFFIVEKKEALQIIDNMKMDEVSSNSYGKIFERQDNSFYEKFQGKGALVPENFAS